MKVNTFIKEQINHLRTIRKLNPNEIFERINYCNSSNAKVSRSVSSFFRMQY